MTLGLGFKWTPLVMINMGSTHALPSPVGCHDTSDGDDLGSPEQVQSRHGGGGMYFFE